jgi:hypothetical protein
LILFDVSSGEIDFPSMMRKEPKGIRPGVSSEMDEFIEDLSFFFLGGFLILRCHFPNDFPSGIHGELHFVTSCFKKITWR